MRNFKFEKFLWLSLCLSFTNLSFSQEKSRPGYIIQTGGDTLRGFVDWREGMRVSKACHFTADPKQNPAVFGPMDVKGYGLVNGKAFQSARITEKDGAAKVVFLEVKVAGEVSLYKHDHSFFVQKAGDSLKMISNDKSEKLMNGKLVMRYSNQHIAVLSTMLFDCVALRERTLNVPFVERHITDLIVDYNICRGAKSVAPNSSKPWVKAMLGLTAGLHMSALEVQSGAFSNAHLSGNYDLTKTPFVGVSFDVLSPRLSERLSFHGSLLYMRPTYRLDKIMRFSLSTHTNEVRIVSNQLKIPVGMRYTFAGEKVAPYFNFGISATLNFGFSSTWQQHIKYTTSAEDNRYTDVWEMRTSQLGYWGGLGVVVALNKKLGAFIEVRYEQTESLGNFHAIASGLHSEVKNVQIIFGIRKK
jgi:hypothetical protein